MSLPTCPLPNGLWQQDSKSPKPIPQWYTIQSSPPLDFDICLSCYQQIASNPHAKHFQLKASIPEDTPAIRCDFSQKWIRLAWLVTTESNVGDLRYLAAVARNAEAFSAEGYSCPVNETSQRQWYSIASPFPGLPVLNWCACRFCVSMIETLAPTLKGQFKPIYFDGSSLQGTWGAQECAASCDLGADNSRTLQYIGHLLAAHETATFGHTPNLTKFYDFVKKWSTIPLCKKDNESVDSGPFYTIPQIPEFTVCNECYINVIETSGTKFPFTPQQSSMLWSCQLYSDRMRRVFSEAVANDDIQFLRQKANERKEKEREVRVRLKALGNQKTQIEAMMKARSQLQSTMAIAAFTPGKTAWGMDLGLHESSSMGNKVVEDSGRLVEIAMQIENTLNEWKTFWE